MCIRDRDDSSYNTKVAMAIASGDMPDVMNVSYTQLVQLVNAGAVEAMTDAFYTYRSEGLAQCFDSTNGISEGLDVYKRQAYRSELVQTVPVTSRRGTEKRRDILSQRAECTAVLVFNDILAWQVICILGELGRKVLNERRFPAAYF